MVKLNLNWWKKKPKEKSLEEKIRETEIQLKRELENPVRDYGYIGTLRRMLAKYKGDKIT